MAKRESSFKNMVVTLTLVTAIAAGTLAMVNAVTEEPIRKAKEAKLKAAINVVVPGAAEGQIREFKVMPAEGNDSLTFYEITKDGEIIGTAVKSYTMKGFSGLITAIVGFDANGVIIDSDVLEHKETPGLGDKLAKKVPMGKDKEGNPIEWNAQFKSQDPASFNMTVTKDGGQIDAITAATISSRAYCDILQRAYDTYMSNKKEGGVE